MNIYVNSPKSLLERVKHSKATFRHIAELSQGSTDGVAIIIENQKAETCLEQVADSGIPAVLLAGSHEEKGGEWYQKAISNGFSEKAIIYMNGGTLISHTDYAFRTPVPKGVTVSAMVELAQYATDNQLVPDMVIFWKPSAQEPVLYNPEPGKSQEAAPLQTPQPAAKPDFKPETRHNNKSGAPGHNVQNTQKSGPGPAPPKQPNETVRATTPPPKVKAEDITDLARNTDCLILAIKTVPNANSGKIAKDIASELGALHVELALKPESYLLYSDHIDKATMSGQYGFSSGNKVQVLDTYRGGKYVVIEADFCPELGDVIEKLHGIAKYDIQIPSSLKTSQPSIANWLEIIRKLDAIIPDDDSNLEQYRQHYPDKTMTVTQFVGSLS